MQDPRWAASSFASLEEFMLDFLTGGGKGESTRLKLQTPVYVALALLEAAQVQLDAELAVAEQEVRTRCCDCCTWKHRPYGSGHCTRTWHTHVAHARTWRWGVAPQLFRIARCACHLLALLPDI